MRVHSACLTESRLCREYVLAGAKAAQVADKAQQVLYCSSVGASSSTPFVFTK